MKLPPFPKILQTVYTISNTTRTWQAFQGNSISGLSSGGSLQRGYLGGIFRSVATTTNLSIGARAQSKASFFRKGIDINTAIQRATLRSMPTIPFLSSFFSSSSSSPSSEKMSYPDSRTDQEWRAQLSPEQFRVLREKGTEAPFTGEYDKHQPKPGSGVYECAGCKAPLYKAEHKFKSGCGWPAYFDALPGAVTRHVDRAFGMERTEIVCSNCGGHLGHVFKGEGYPTPTDERHCVNSVSIKFNSDDKVVDNSGSAGKS